MGRAGGGNRAPQGKERAEQDFKLKIYYYTVNLCYSFSFTAKDGCLSNTKLCSPIRASSPPDPIVLTPVLLQQSQAGVEGVSKRLLNKQAKKKFREHHFCVQRTWKNSYHITVSTLKKK